MEHDDFIVLFENILPGGLDRRFDISDAAASGLELAAPLASPLEAECMLTRHGSRVLVRGRLSGALALECSRCLKSFPFPLDIAFETHLETGRNGTVDADHQLSPEEMDIEAVQKGSVDLREILAEQIHLAVPVKTLCGEECRGLCPRCGADLNRGDCSCGEERTDPRWEALRQLKES